MPVTKYCSSRTCEQDFKQSCDLWIIVFEVLIVARLPVYLGWLGAAGEMLAVELQSIISQAQGSRAGGGGGGGGGSRSHPGVQVKVPSLICPGSPAHQLSLSQQQGSKGPQTSGETGLEITLCLSQHFLACYLWDRHREMKSSWKLRYMALYLICSAPLTRELRNCEHLLRSNRAWNYPVFFNTSWHVTYRIGVWNYPENSV